MHWGLIAAVLVSVGALMREYATDGFSHALGLLSWIVWPLAMLGTSVMLNHPVGHSREAMLKRMRFAWHLHIAGWILLIGMILVILTAKD